MGRILRWFAAALVVFLVSGFLLAQEKSDVPPVRIAIRAGRLIAGKSDSPLSNAVILIEGDKIVSVTSGGAPPAGADVLDLSKATVLPGFIDARTQRSEK
jgi:imidazolonepropionase-like amidohydrolase